MGLTIQTTYLTLLAESAFPPVQKRLILPPYQVKASKMAFNRPST